MAGIKTSFALSGGNLATTGAQATGWRGQATGRKAKVTVVAICAP
jgi:hypothetical protein